MFLASIKLVLTPILISIGTLVLLFVLSPAAHSGSSEAFACRGSGGDWDEGTATCDFPDAPNIQGDDSFLSSITNILLFVVGVASVIFLIINGFKLVVSNGDPQAVASARQGILYSVVGVIVAFLSFAFITFVVDAVENPPPEPDPQPPRAIILEKTGLEHKLDGYSTPPRAMLQLR